MFSLPVYPLSYAYMPIYTSHNCEDISEIFSPISKVVAYTHFNAQAFTCFTCSEVNNVFCYLK